MYGNLSHLSRQMNGAPLVGFHQWHWEWTPARERRRGEDFLLIHLNGVTILPFLSGLRH